MNHALEAYYQYVFPDGTPVGPKFISIEWARKISGDWPEDFARGATLYEYTLSRKPYEAGS